MKMSVFMHDKAIAALMRTRFYQRSPKELGISPDTLRIWMKRNDDFRAAYEEARGRLLDRAVGER